MQATYNITDDRLKFYPERRLTDDEYKRARSLGLSFFHGQKCFSGVWSPGRVDFILEFVDHIGNEENPDDVESRIARFQRYAQNDEQAAEYAQERAANATTDRRAKQAESTAQAKIEEAAYWNRRIAGAIRAAEYKDRPDVIGRRIKKLEADHRKHTKELDKAQRWLKLWTGIPGTVKAKDGHAVNLKEAALYLAQFDRSGVWSRLQDDRITPQVAQAECIAGHESSIKFHTRWIEHLDLRLEYERAYLAAVAGEDRAAAILAPKKRTVAQAPDDGLKKGDIVSVKVYRENEIPIVGPILSLGAKNVKVRVPEDHWSYDSLSRWGERVNGEVIKHVRRKDVTKV